MSITRSFHASSARPPVPLDVRDAAHRETVVENMCVHTALPSSAVAGVSVRVRFLLTLELLRRFRHLQQQAAEPTVNQ